MRQWIKRHPLPSICMAVLMAGLLTWGALFFAAHWVGFGGPWPAAPRPDYNSFYPFLF